MLQIFSLPLEVLGVLLAMLEVFSPTRAERVTMKIIDTSNNMRSFASGILVIATLGLSEAKLWQRIVVVGGIMAMLAFLVHNGGADSLLMLLILWPSSTLLIIVTYTVIFLIFKVVRHFFPTRVLGIIGVLTATVGLILESTQYAGALNSWQPKALDEGIDFAGMTLVIFYGAIFLCLTSLLWAAFGQSESSAESDRHIT